MSWGIVFRVRQQLKGSLYALPILGALLGPLLGQLTIWLDQNVSLGVLVVQQATSTLSPRFMRL